MGAGAAKGRRLPPAGRGRQSLRHYLSDPFYDKGPNDKGIGIQLGYSLPASPSASPAGMLMALPLGFLIGMSPLAMRALDPFIQVLKPISPLAWMPLALYT
jgi:nitrate/nitrite transport system permease protein